MRIAIVAAIFVVGVGTARLARVRAAAERTDQVLAEAPYAPSASSAPMLTLGYRELAADLLFVRLVGYYGSPDNEAHAIASLAEAIAALDPQFRRNYEFGAVATTSARRGVDNAAHLRAIALLEKAAREFPTHWRYPNLAGQIYLVDLQTDDPAQRREWNQKGALLLESAARKPNAPAESALVASNLRTRLGQHQRALDGLREMLLITDDRAARERIIEQIAILTSESSDEIAAEMLIARKQFERTWHATRPAVPATMFVLVGPPIAPSFSLADLATGGRDVVGSEGFERLDALTDEPTPPAPGTP
jgi:tetratricopeptide (TPR) repeat protein